MSLTANFLTEVEKTNFRGNLVIKIDSTYFSQYQPDSGLTVDSDKVGLVDNAKINGTKIDIRRANTPITTMNFRLLDKGAIISSFLGSSANSLQNSPVELYFGFITGSFDFSDYALLANTRINSVSKLENAFNFTSKEVRDLLQTDLLNTFNTLDSGISDTDTSLDLKDASAFPSSGSIKINDEFIDYAGKTDDTLTGLSRGTLTSEASSHNANDLVELVTLKTGESMDVLLDIIINDLGLDPSLIDQTSFTDLRDGEFSGESDYTYRIYGVTNGLRWIEERILISTNTRLFSVNGVITIALLDDVPKFESTPEINEDHTIRNPSWKLSSDRIVNKVIALWAFNDGQGEFANLTEYTDSDSIATYEERGALTLELYGIYDPTIVANRANRLLSRLSTPRAQIKAVTQFNRFPINVGDNVLLTHRFIPQQGGSLGFSDTLEVMSRAVSGMEADSRISFDLEFSSYTGIRFGLISPSPALDLAITDQRTFTVPDGSCYGVGFRLVLFDNVNNVYFSDPPNTIQSIDGNVITMANEFTTALGSNVSLYFADYDNSSGDQRAQYAYVAPDTGVFTIDGSKAYQIIF